jgi:hypothetical protein
MKKKDDLVTPPLVKTITAFGVFFLLILIFDIVRLTYYTCCTQKGKELTEEQDFD